MSTLPNALVLGAVMSRSFEPARLADLKLLFRAYCRVERVGELARLGEAVALLKAPEAAASGASPEAVALLARAPRRAVIWPCPDEALIAYGDGERHTHYDGGTGAMSAVASPHERRADGTGGARSSEVYFSPKAKDAFARVKAIVALEKGRQVATFLKRTDE